LRASIQSITGSAGFTGILPAAMVVGEYAWSRALGNVDNEVGKTKVNVNKRNIKPMKAPLNSLPT
jgi:hypothetical protein